MLERELRQRELQADLAFPSSALVPVLHPPPLSVSPGLHCCPLNKDAPAAGASSYVPVYKYKPLYECDLQFYQFLWKSRSSTEGDCNDAFCRSSEQGGGDGEVLQDGWKVCDKRDRPELMPSQHGLRNHGSTGHSGPELVKASSKPTEIMHSNGSVFRSDQAILGASGVSATSRAFDPRLLTAKGWSADTAAAQAGPHADSVKSPHGSSVRTPAVRPLPFSVEALLRA